MPSYFSFLVIFRFSGAEHFDLDGGIDYPLPAKDLLWDYEIGAAYAVSVFIFARRERARTFGKGGHLRKS